VDDDLGRAALAARVPRRAHEQPVVDQHRPVERAPALGPVVADLAGAHVDERGAGRRAQVGELGQLAGRAVDGVLDEAGVGQVDLLDARRRQLEQVGQRDLRVLAPHAYRQADHRSTKLPAMWPPEALEFLRELEADNDRDWFRANRERYDAHLLEPARALADRLRHLGQPHFFRPYNDTRFHARPPIKEQLGVAIGYGATGGFYFELSLDGLLVAAGVHRPATPQLERFRRGIDDGRRAKSFDRALRPATQAGLELAPPALKRAPRGYPVDHPRVELLRLRQL